MKQKMIQWAVILGFAGILAYTFYGYFNDPEDWTTWPRVGSVPQATDDCVTDACLEYREAVLQHQLGITVEEQEDDEYNEE